MSDAEYDASTPPDPITPSLRFTLFVHGVVFPCLVMGLSLSGKEAHTMVPFWPLNILSAYAAVALRPIAWFPFAPAILYSIVCMATWTIWPNMGNRTWVRMGVTLGVPLSLQFLLLLLAIFHAPMLITIIIVWFGWQTALALVGYLYRRQFSIWQIFVLMTISALLAVGLQSFVRIEAPEKIEILKKIAYYIPALAAFSMLVAAPGLNFIAYCIAAQSLPWPDPASPPLEMLRQKRWRLGWIFYYVCAWRWAVLTSLEQYKSLSFTLSNCYLSNAAAYAHPILTGAARRGEVTNCMRRLKFLEIVLKASVPNLHRRLRKSYDGWCPPLAQYCQRSIYFATLTFFLLLPLEMLAEIFRMALSIDRKQIRSIYGAEEKSENVSFLHRHKVGGDDGTRGF